MYLARKGKQGTQGIEQRAAVVGLLRGPDRRRLRPPGSPTAARPVANTVGLSPSALSRPRARRGPPARSRDLELRGQLPHGVARRCCTRRGQPCAARRGRKARARAATSSRGNGFARATPSATAYVHARGRRLETCRAPDEWLACGIGGEHAPRVDNWLSADASRAHRLSVHVGARVSLGRSRAKCRRSATPPVRRGARALVGHMSLHRTSPRSSPRRRDGGLRDRRPRARHVQRRDFRGAGEPLTPPSSRARPARVAASRLPRPIAGE